MLKMANSRRSNLNVYSLLNDEHFFVARVISRRSILNDISSVQTSILSIAASACLARRNTIENAEPSKKFYSIFFLHSKSRSHKHNTYINLYLFD